MLSEIDSLDEFTVSRGFAAAQILLLVLSLAMTGHVLVAAFKNHFGYEGQRAVAEGIVGVFWKTDSNSDFVMEDG